MHVLLNVRHPYYYQICLHIILISHLGNIHIRDQGFQCSLRVDFLQEVERKRHRTDKAITRMISLVFKLSQQEIWKCGISDL